MSQRSTKARISALLAERDRAHDLLRAYDAVICDVSCWTAPYLSRDRERVVQRIASFQAQADELAAMLRVPKASFSGRAL